MLEPFFLRLGVAHSPDRRWATRTGAFDVRQRRSQVVDRCMKFVV
jgi:hypothetical protein